MPLDTFSNTLGFIIMGTGNDNNTWGVNANSFAFQILEDAIAGTLTEAVTGGTLDISGSPPPAAASQARFARISFTGTLTSNQTLIVPNLNKIWLVGNGTTGAFSVLMKTPSGPVTQIPQGTFKWVMCDGANTVRRTDFNEISRCEDFYSAGVPPGFLATNGSAISRTGFPDLFGIVGTLWGVGDGSTTFNLPNTTDTGRFKRSNSGSLSVGTSQSNQNASHTHTLSGTTTDTEGQAHNHNYSGSNTTGNDSPDHTHNMTNSGAFLAGGGSNGQILNDGGSVFNTGGASTRHQHSFSWSGTTLTENQNHTHTMSSLAVNASGGSEARPESIVVLSCIRY